jgi:hypothetical protein
MNDNKRNISKYANHKTNIIGKGAKIHIKVWYAISQIMYFKINSLIINQHSLAGPLNG